MTFIIPSVTFSFLALNDVHHNAPQTTFHIFQWEAKTGKVYRSLTVDERVDANKEIDAMRAAMRRATLGGH